MDIDAHIRRHTSARHTHSDRETKGIVGQRRKCRCEQESVGKADFTPVSTETTVHQQGALNPPDICSWQKQTYLFKTPTQKRFLLINQLDDKQKFVQVDLKLEGKHLSKGF